MRYIKKYENNKPELFTYYHGTTLKNFNKVENINTLYFTPLYDDAVMYALMGNESSFESKIKNASAKIIELLYDNPKKALIKLFDKDDKPIILVYETTEDYTDKYELTFDGITKKDVKIKYIDFNEYDNIEPVWFDLNIYL